ncbi:MAG: CopG family transcriptional regulator [Chloroflexota bacterium]
MRTTVDIDNDVLMAAREIAGRRGVSMGKVLSDLGRQALTHRIDGGSRHGVPLFPAGKEGGIVSLELVNRLHDEAP